MAPKKRKKAPSSDDDEEDDGESEGQEDAKTEPAVLCDACPADSPERFNHVTAGHALVCEVDGCVGIGHDTSKHDLLHSVCGLRGHKSTTSNLCPDQVLSTRKLVSTECSRN
jgi:hypothetical protein